MYPFRFFPYILSYTYTSQGGFRPTLFLTLIEKFLLHRCGEEFLLLLVISQGNFYAGSQYHMHSTHPLRQIN